MLKFSNFGKAIVGSAPSGTTGLSFTVEAGKGLLFPTLGTGDYFYGIFKDASGNREIVKVTGRSTDSMTIEVGGRGLDGTTARSWAAGDYFVAGLVNAALTESLGNENLNALGNLTSAADKLPYYTGSHTAALANFTSFGRSLIDDADAATARATLGALAASSVSSYILGLLDDPNAAGARTTLGAASKAGTTTNDSAATGDVGEFKINSIGSGSSVALVSGDEKNIATLSLTAGDWDLYGNVLYLYGSTTRITHLQGSTSLISSSLDATARFAHAYPGGIVPATLVPMGWPTPPQRVSIASTTTVYLVAYGLFTVNYLSAYGDLWARRAR